MKKVIFILAVTIQLAGCNGAGNTTAMQHTIDSLVQLIPAGATNASVAPPEPNLVYAISIPTDTAFRWVLNYHKAIGFDASRKRNGGKGRPTVSFMLDAGGMWQYLSRYYKSASNPNPQYSVSKLDFYIAQNSQGDMTLVYIGDTTRIDTTIVKTKAGGDSTVYTTSYVEVPWLYTGSNPNKGQNNVQMMFDNTTPCPQCLDRIRIFDSMSKKMNQ